MALPKGPWGAHASIGAITATTDSGAVFPVWLNPHSCTVEITDADISGVWTANATHYVSILLKDGDGNTIATKALSATSCTGSGYVDMGTLTNQYIAAGETVYATVTQTNNGLSITRLPIDLAYEMVRGA